MEGHSPSSAQSPDLAALLGVAPSQAMDGAVASTIAPINMYAHAESMLNNLQGLTSAFGFTFSFDMQEHAPDPRGHAFALDVHNAVICKSCIFLAFTGIQEDILWRITFGTAASRINVKQLLCSGMYVTAVTNKGAVAAIGMSQLSSHLANTGSRSSPRLSNEACRPIIAGLHFPSQDISQAPAEQQSSDLGSTPSPVRPQALRFVNVHPFFSGVHTVGDAVQSENLAAFRFPHRLGEDEAQADNQN